MKILEMNYEADSAEEEEEIDYANYGKKMYLFN